MRSSWAGTVRSVGPGERTRFCPRREAADALLRPGTGSSVPFYLRSGVFTMPEFLERRYDGRSRWFLSVVMLVGYVTRR